MSQPLLFFVGLLFIGAAFLRPLVIAQPLEQQDAHVVLKNNVEQWRKQSAETQKRYRGFVDAEDVAQVDYQKRVTSGNDWPAWMNISYDTLYPGRVGLQIWNDHDLWVKHGYDPDMWSNTSRSLTPKDARTTALIIRSRNSSGFASLTFLGG